MQAVHEFDNNWFYWPIYGQHILQVVDCESGQANLLEQSGFAKLRFRQLAWRDMGRCVFGGRYDLLQRDIGWSACGTESLQLPIGELRVVIVGELRLDELIIPNCPGIVALFLGNPCKPIKCG